MTITPSELDELRGQLDALRATVIALAVEHVSRPPDGPPPPQEQLRVLRGRAHIAAVLREDALPAPGLARLDATQRALPDLFAEIERSVLAALAPNPGASPH